MAVYDEDHKGYRVFIGDLGTKVFKYELQKEFEYYGEVKDVWLARNPPGFAFVVFKFEEDANNAVRKLNGRIVCRRRVRVEHALPYGEKRFPNREPARRSSWSTPAKPAYRSRSRERRRDRSRSRSVSRDRRRERSLSRSRSRSKQRSVDRRGRLSTPSRRSLSMRSKKRNGSSRSRSRSRPSSKSKMSRRESGSKSHDRSHDRARDRARDKSRSTSRKRSEKASLKKDVNGECCDNEARSSEGGRGNCMGESGNQNGRQPEATSPSPGDVKEEEVDSAMDVTKEQSTADQDGEMESLDSVAKTESSVVKREVPLQNDLEEVVNGCTGAEDKVKSELLESVKGEESSEGSKEGETAGGEGTQCISASTEAHTNGETCEM